MVDSTRETAAKVACRTPWWLFLLLLVSFQEVEAAVGWQFVREVSRDRAVYNEFPLAVDIEAGQVVATGSLVPTQGVYFAGSAITFSATGSEPPRELLPQGTPANNAFIYPATSANRILVGDDEDPNPTTGAAYLFDRNNGQQLVRLTAPDGVDGLDYWYGQGVELTDEYALVVAAGFRNGGVYLYDAQDGAFRQKLTNNQPGFTPNSVAAEGDYAIVGEPSTDSAYLFDLATGTLLRELVRPSLSNQDIFGVDVAIDGRYAAVASRDTSGSGADGYVSVYDVATGELQYTLPGSFHQLSGIDLDDGRLILSASSRTGNNTLIHQVSTGRLLGELPFAHSVAIDGDTVALGRANQVVVYQFVPEPAACCLAIYLGGLATLATRSTRRRIDTNARQ